MAPPRHARRKRLNAWNMGIAHTHRLTTQLVGIQLSGANLLALTVSAASVVAGTVSLVAQKYPGNWPLLISAGVIGLGLALLIEGLTLGSLIRIRLANRAIRACEEQIASEMSAALAALPVPDPAHSNASAALRQYRQTARLIRHHFRRKRQQATSLQRSQRRFALPFAAMGAISSATAGGLFYHTILAQLGPGESLVLAILFPLVVTGTFLSSEIQKDAQEEAIKEGFGGGALTETAIREETKLRSTLAVHQHVMAYLEKPEAEQAIEAGAQALLHTILDELHESAQQATRHVLVSEERDDYATRQLAPVSRRGDTQSPESQGKSDTTPAPANMHPLMPSSYDKTTDGTRQREKAWSQTTTARSNKATDNPTQEAPPMAYDTPRWETRTADNTFLQREYDMTRHPPGGEAGKQHAWDVPAIEAPPFLRPSERHFPPGPELKAHPPSVAPDRTLVSDSYTEPGNDTRHDTTDFQEPVLSPEKTERQRQPQAQAETPAHDDTPSAEYDTLTARILAYVAAHPQAKQRDVAQALNVAVRTVQRRLAALKQQPPEEEHPDASLKPSS